MSDPSESATPPSTPSSPPTPSKKDVDGTPQSVLGQPVDGSPASTGPDPAEIIAAARAREAAEAASSPADPATAALAPGLVGQPRGTGVPETDHDAAAALSRSAPGAAGDSLPPLPAEGSRRGRAIALGVVALAVVVVIIVVLVVVL